MRCVVLPLRTLGESRAESRSLSRHAPSSREVGGASRDDTMSVRSMFLRAACRLSTGREATTMTGQVGEDGRGQQPAGGRRLTLGSLALPARPQAEQGGALVQQRVGVLHADPVDVVHAEVQFAGQLWRKGGSSGRGQRGRSLLRAPRGPSRNTDLPSSGPAAPR